MLTLAKKLTPKFFENNFGLNAPHAWTLGYLLDPLIVSETWLSHQLVNLKRNLRVVFVELGRSFCHCLHNVELDLF